MGKFSFTQTSVTVHYVGKDAGQVLGQLMNDGPDAVEIVDTHSLTTIGFQPNEPDEEDGDNDE